MATDFLVNDDGEHSLFGDEYDPNFFSSANYGGYENEHNYARMSSEYSTSSSVSLQSTNSYFENQSAVQLVTPVQPEPIDDLAFVEDLIPISEAPSSSATSSDQESLEPLSYAISLSDPINGPFDALPDLCGLIDKETLMEALCLDMPNGASGEFIDGLMRIPEANDDQQSAGLVSTLFDYISSATFIPKSADQKSLLPMHSGDCDNDSQSSIRSRNFRPTAIQGGIDVVTDEERIMMAREGVVLPIPSDPDEPIVLSDEQDKALKSVRRKLRNKESAKESRKRKAEYIDTLEKRVKVESSINGKLNTRVHELEQENESLSSRLQYMQGFVQKLIGNIKKQQQPMQKSTCLFVMLFALCLVMAPRGGRLSLPSSSSHYDSLSGFNSAAAFNSAIALTEAVPADVSDAAMQAHPLIPKSFVFTYDMSVVDRAADL